MAVKWITTPITADNIRSSRMYHPIKNAVKEGIVIIIAIIAPLRKILFIELEGIFSSFNLRIIKYGNKN